MNIDREKYQTIFESTPNPILILDVESRIDDVNSAAFELCRNILPSGFQGYAKTDVCELFPWIREDLENFIAQDALESGIEKAIETDRGEIHFQIKFKRMLNGFDKFIGTIVILNDVSYLKQVEKTVARARDFYLTLFEEFPALIWRAGLDGRFDYVNRAWLQFTGRTAEEATGNGWMKDIHSEDLFGFQESSSDAFRNKRPFESEFRIKRQDGAFRWFLSVGRPFNDLEGRFAGFIGSCYDITDRKNHEEELIFMATHDALTGLPNRRVLEADLPRIIAKRGRGTRSVLLSLDLDGFKHVNDTFGHNIGDQVLIEIGFLLKKLVRESDLLTRLGGDEFSILLEDIDRESAKIIAQRLCENVAGHDFLQVKGHLHLSLSIGLTVIGEHEIPAEILSRADRAMYKAKELGGNQIAMAE
jgi:diguanylate cyclase (GGDEF)-like protein/PAS domain S-box-containing protein